MCNLYSMTATVDELRRTFGPFARDTTNVPPFDGIYTSHAAPIARLHPKAMPVMLRAADVGEWLDSDRVEACALAQPFEDSAMRIL